MRNFLMILKFFICFSCFGQEQIYFDLFTNYEIINLDSNAVVNGRQNHIILSASNNNNLDLIIKRGFNKNLFGIAFNSTNKISHYFDIPETKNDTLDVSAFIYKFSVDWSDSNCFNPDSAYQISDISDNPEFNLQFTSFTNTRYKNIQGKLLLEKRESEKSYYNNFKRGFLHHFDSCDKVVINPNIIVHAACFVDRKGIIYSKIKLIDFAIVDFKVTINKLIFKSKNEAFDFLNNK